MRTSNRFLRWMILLVVVAATVGIGWLATEECDGRNSKFWVALGFVVFAEFALFLAPMQRGSTKLPWQIAYWGAAASTYLLLTLIMAGVAGFTEITVYTLTAWLLLWTALFAVSAISLALAVRHGERMETNFRRERGMYEQFKADFGAFACRAGLLPDDLRRRVEAFQENLRYRSAGGSAEADQIMAEAANSFEAMKAAVAAMAAADSEDGELGHRMRAHELLRDIEMKLDWREKQLKTVKRHG